MKVLISIILLVSTICLSAQKKDSVVYKPSNTDVISLDDIEAAYKKAGDEKGITSNEHQKFLQAYIYLIQYVEKKRILKLIKKP